MPMPPAEQQAQGAQDASAESWNGPAAQVAPAEQSATGGEAVEDTSALGSHWTSRSVPRLQQPTFPQQPSPESFTPTQHPAQPQRGEQPYQGASQTDQEYQSSQQDQSAWQAQQPGESSWQGQQQQDHNAQQQDDRREGASPEQAEQQQDGYSSQPEPEQAQSPQQSAQSPGQWTQGSEPSVEGPEHSVSGTVNGAAQDDGGDDGEGWRFWPPADQQGKGAYQRPS
jgi:hypothetical protein